MPSRSPSRRGIESSTVVFMVALMAVLITAGLVLAPTQQTTAGAGEEGQETQGSAFGNIMELITGSSGDGSDGATDGGDGDDGTDGNDLHPDACQESTSSMIGEQGPIPVAEGEKEVSIEFENGCIGPFRVRAANTEQPAETYMRTGDRGIATICSGRVTDYYEGGGPCEGNLGSPGEEIVADSYEAGQTYEWRIIQESDGTVRWEVYDGSGNKLGEKSWEDSPFDKIDLYWATGDTNIVNLDYPEPDTETGQDYSVSGNIESYESFWTGYEQEASSEHENAAWPSTSGDTWTYTPTELEDEYRDGDISGTFFTNWDVGSGDKTVYHGVSFDKLGEYTIQSPDREFRVSTNRCGELWAYFENDAFGETGRQLEENTNYLFIIERSGGSLTFTIIDADAGEEVWSADVETSDFSRVQIISDISPAATSPDACARVLPETTLKRMETE